MSHERYPGGSILNRRVSRRRFNSAAVEAVWVIGLSGAALGAISYVVATNEGESQKLYGQSTDGEIKRLVVDILPNDRPLLRSKLSLDDDDILGVLTVGKTVSVIEVLGPVYPTGQSDLRVAVKGEDYGLWYKVIEPVLVTKESGTAIKATGFIAGNFLKKPEEPSGK